MSSRFLVLAAVLTSFPSSFGYTHSQSDWSEGPGALGPNTQWTDQFWQSYQMEYSMSDSLLLFFCQFGEENVIDDSLGFPDIILAADINGDDLMDILCTRLDYDEGPDILWWENSDGSGLNLVEHVVTGSLNGITCAVTADIDGDGDEDVLGVSGYVERIAWWENADGHGTSWAEHQVSDSFAGSRHADADDIDGDGHTDVVAVSTTGNVAWWENADGSGTSWTEHSIDSGYGTTINVILADIDGDEDNDVVAGSYSLQRVYWWENTDGSGGSWTVHLMDLLQDPAKSIEAADIDGDDDTDVLLACYDNQGFVLWLENDDGAGSSWTEHQIDYPFAGASWACTGHLDSDEHLDVIASGWSEEITYWLNTDGSGTVWQEMSISGGLDAARCVSTADINSDGFVDALACDNAGTGIAAWYDGALYPDHGWLESSILWITTYYEPPQWKQLSCVVDEPVGTSTSFQVRASDDYTNMGPWSDTLPPPIGLDTIPEVSPGDRYIQYRVFLWTEDQASTPVLDSVVVWWEDPLSIESGSGLVEPGACLAEISPNPAIGTAWLQITMPVREQLVLSVFDLTGRLILRTDPVDYQIGTHRIPLAGLDPGLYFCHLRAGDYSGRECFVLLADQE
ncbi:T9SS type A sorting domain-containing protein [Candidatus Fermentibacterales bacterium]|nr:T9SS type A sorting domain-containing protein [Candidatus Fermentibacterales bacterium]